ncbi:NAD(P)-binding protein [Pseudonocardia sp. HH130629-09]|uniref:NAD(P)-binding protein n=1 Tax=Pseudonocardia sp. HH130629-09 TaxID=1641402 RepID=UPI000AE14184|nr:NAD(P)-binding protein [Pseudonocardia sp. HH130629-09]
MSDDDLEGDDDPYLLLNAAWYEGRRPVPVAGTERTTVAPPAGGGPLRVAVVGSGPAACYAVESLFARRELDVRVSMFERLPVPGGLLRYGVAPDHPGTRV